MIRIEQFLFEKNVEQSQAESLISEFSNLTFNSMDEFESFFTENNIRLVITSDIQSRTRKSPEKVELLQRFKEFKSSTDYDYVKKYIAEQRKIQALIKDGNFVVAKNLLDGITLQPVDPFFNFVVRKMLTGSPNGVLPSENLKTIIDNLAKQTKPEIDTEVDVTRDDFGKIISFDNYLKNKGSVRVDVLDERFSVESLRYVIPNEFTQLPEAVQAERNVLRVANEVFQNIDDLSSDTVGGGAGGGTGGGANLNDIDEQKLIDNLKKLIVEDSNSKLALEVKLEAEKERADGFEQMVFEKNRDIANLREVIIEVSSQAELAERNKEFLNETIVSLNETINSTLSDLEGNVSQQLTNTSDAFDALAAQLEAQAKKSEEAAAKQLAAFEKAVGGIADALKPAEPEPDPENPAAEIIKQIIEKWDGMTVITEALYPKFVQILDTLGANKPTKSTYVFVPPANRNAYVPSEEIKQHLKWNTELKPQIKALLPQINDKTKAETVLKNVNDIRNDNNGSFNNNGFVTTISDALDAWANDAGKVRGFATQDIRKVALELGAKFPDSGDLGSDANGARIAAANIKAKLTRDTEQLINILTIMDAIKNKGSAFGW
jgi:hypothetical protein